MIIQIETTIVILNWHNDEGWSQYANYIESKQCIFYFVYFLNVISKVKSVNFTY